MKGKASSAQFSPALGVVMLFTGVVITCYVYRHIILFTIMVVFFAAVSAAFLAGLIMLSVHIIKWDRKKIASESVRNEADWLADAGVELAWSPDGKTLEASDGRTLKFRGSVPPPPEV